MKQRIIVLACLTLAACTNTKDPVLTENRCTRSHTTTDVVYVTTFASCGKDCTYPQIMPTYVVIDHCDASIALIYPNPDYRRTQ